jgi:K+-transporting ATPase ATPase A chain
MSETAKFAGLFVLCVGTVLLCAKPLGSYIADVMEGRRNFATAWAAVRKHLLYRCCGIDSQADMTWLQYAKALLLFNAIGALFVYALQRLQSGCP